MRGGLRGKDQERRFALWRPVEEANSRGDENRPTGKAFNVILTDDHGAVSVLEMKLLKNKIFGVCIGRWTVQVYGLNRDGIGSPC